MLCSLFAHHRYGKHHASHCGCFAGTVLSVPLINPHAHLAFFEWCRSLVPHATAKVFIDVLASSLEVQSSTSCFFVNYKVRFLVQCGGQQKTLRAHVHRRVLILSIIWIHFTWWIHPPWCYQTRGRRLAGDLIPNAAFPHV